jgi:hypothetical protein
MATKRKAPARQRAQPPVYTYRGGQKMLPRKDPDSFVVRAVGDPAVALGVRSPQQVSSGSTRVKVRPTELERKMAQSRKL